MRDIASAGFILTVFIALLLKIATQGRRKDTSLQKLPGPKPLPILGNVWDIDKHAPWTTYKKWEAIYGGILRCRLLSEEIIVVNSLDIAKDLLGTRSSNYSSRPDNSIDELIGSDWNSVNLAHGDLWRLHRKLLQQSFRPNAVLHYRLTQLKKTQELVISMLESPDKCITHLAQFSAATILSIIYDYDVIENDPILTSLEKWNRLILGLITVEAWAMRSFLMRLPIWLTGTSLKEQGLLLRQYMSVWMEVPFEHVKNNITAGTAKPCMVSEMQSRLVESSELGRPDKITRDVAATAFAAAVETTSSVLHVFVLAMVMHPEVQERARAELDSILGTDRLPTFEDRPFLPYLDAILRETLRWNPVVPLGVPHVVEEDDVYRGYHIPKGSTIYANTWAMTRDETKYPEPSKFRPERFLTTNGELTDDTVGFVFGFGRRICVGRYFADGSTWLAIVSLLATFEFLKAVDENGNDIEVTAEFTSGVTSQPAPFPYRIIPRTLGADTERLR
ncbi:cytochrome P450 [Hygrophoropsis aurantiaca]|uniref:Cytochrome P450 n=1 Tax=Hygrophoropsis aurantiaca TaxID=72124 RepID=A0ACB8A008_9AGAM|nr:cytochrome P450 [Hygrophoropsis aurantiaca]